MACLQIYQELLSLTTFLWVPSNLKEISNLSWQNTYPNSKSNCHMKLKFFLWTKLLENLLHCAFNVSISSRLKTNFFFVNTKCIHKYDVPLNKTPTKLVPNCTILTKCFFYISEPYKLPLHCSQPNHFNVTRSVSRQPS